MRHLCRAHSLFSVDAGEQDGLHEHDSAAQVRRKHSANLPAAALQIAREVGSMGTAALCLTTTNQHRGRDGMATAASRQLSLYENELTRVLSDLPQLDNTSEALATLRRANALLRKTAWPAPFDTTMHQLRLGDARELDWLADESIHLIVTSPPYWILKKYNNNEAQLGAVREYDSFLDELDRVWRHCARLLVPGGRACVVVGDVALARRAAGRHMVMPLHSDIQVRMRRIGLDNLTPIHWYKVANGVTEAAGNGAGYYGKPYQPGAVVKNDVEYILFFRKGGTYRSVSPLQKALSMLTKDEMQRWFRTVWSDLPGASTRHHPAPFPQELATRLIRMFSFVGDVVLDPFLGTGTTVIGAMETGRHSIGVEIDPEYLRAATARIGSRASEVSERGPVAAEVVLTEPAGSDFRKPMVVD